MAIEHFGGSVSGLEVYGTWGDLTDGTQPSQSEVTKRRFGKLREQDAFRIDISVQNPLSVCTFERPGNLDAERGHILWGERGRWQSRGGGWVAVLQHEDRLPLARRKKAEKRDHVGV